MYDILKSILSHMLLLNEMNPDRLICTVLTQISAMNTWHCFKKCVLMNRGQTGTYKARYGLGEEHVLLLLTSSELIKSMIHIELQKKQKFSKWHHNRGLWARGRGAPPTWQVCSLHRREAEAAHQLTGGSRRANKWTLMLWNAMAWVRDDWLIK